MKPEEDIGSLIKTKLQSAQKASKESTWERIQHSLEERRKKRRIAFYYKVGAAGLLVLLGALFMLNYISTDTEPTISKKDIYSTTDTPITDELHISTDAENVSENKNITNLGTTNAVHQEVFEKKQMTTISEDFNETSKIDQTASNTKIKNEIVASNDTISFTNLSPKTKNTKAADTIINRNDVPVTQTTQKVYYYYNSKNGQEVSSTNKRVIDSVVEINQKRKDSLQMKNWH